MQTAHQQRETTPGPPSWAAALLAWFSEHARAMPWRETRDPYHIWVSEIMLQQTQVETVRPYYERFIARFPTVAELAAADLDEVLKLWEGLGYYTRARNLHKAAGVVVADHAGTPPSTFAALQTLPGLGPYTAAAVASIAHGEPVPTVDGNVLRVFARFWALAEDVRQPRARRELQARLEPVLQTVDPAAFNQAMMELGALVCRPTSPTCLLCPLASDCVALADGRVDELPVRSRRGPVPHRRLAAALVEEAGQLLMVQRPPVGFLGGLWTVPSAAVAADAEPAPAAAAALAADGVAGSALANVPTVAVKHAYTHFTLDLIGVRCQTAARERLPERWRRVPMADISGLACDGATRKLLAAAGVATHG
jgi:A/G-specific adenine glycosylase